MSKTTQKMLDEQRKKLDKIREEAETKKMEKIMDVVRKIKPILDKQNDTTNNIRMICSVLSNTIQQMAMSYGFKLTLKELEIKEIRDNPLVTEIFSILQDENSDVSLKALEWFANKINKVREERVKNEKFSEIDLEIPVC